MFRPTLLVDYCSFSGYRPFRNAHLVSSILQLLTYVLRFYFVKIVLLPIYSFIQLLNTEYKYRNPSEQLTGRFGFHFVQRAAVKIIITFIVSTLF